MDPAEPDPSLKSVHCVQDQSKYSNIEYLPEESIEEILHDLEETLLEMENEEAVAKQKTMEEEEKNLRECALKSMLTGVDKNNEDLIEFSLNEIERQTVDSQCSTKDPLFPVTDESTRNDGKFPSFSVRRDAHVFPIHISSIPKDSLDQKTDINNNQGGQFQKAVTVYNKVASISPIFFSAISNQQVKKPQNRREEKELSYSSISDKDISDRESICKPKRKKLKSIKEVS